MVTGKLYLIPTPLQGASANTISLQASIVCSELEHFAVENLKAARANLKALNYKLPIQSASFYEITKETKFEELERIIAVCLKENNLGLLSDVGSPTIADPGANLVRLAHQKNISVIPLSGPCSITLALMASGLNGQNFEFLGYLPVKSNERKIKITAIERESKKSGKTFIFIETPFRNQKLFEDLLKTLQSETYLSIASNIGSEQEYIKTYTIRNWCSMNKIPDIDNKPTVFSFGLLERKLLACM